MGPLCPNEGLWLTGLATRDCPRIRSLRTSVRSTANHERTEDRGRRTHPETRTRTSLRTLVPETSAATNYARWADVREKRKPNRPCHQNTTSWTRHRESNPALGFPKQSFLTHGTSSKAGPGFTDRARAPERNRTPSLPLTRRMLCQLSYKGARGDASTGSPSRPHRDAISHRPNCSSQRSPNLSPHTERSPSHGSEERWPMYSPESARHRWPPRGRPSSTCRALSAAPGDRTLDPPVKSRMLYQLS